MSPLQPHAAGTDSCMRAQLHGSRGLTGDTAAVRVPFEPRTLLPCTLTLQAVPPVCPVQVVPTSRAVDCFTVHRCWQVPTALA